MGRPPLNVKPILVRLTDEQRRRIESTVGPQRIAAFIREAVDEKLEREASQAGARPAGDSKAEG